MNNETQIQAISGMVQQLMEKEPEYFLVEIRMAPGNHIKLFVDGDNGVSIDKCVSINRALYKQIEENGMFSDSDFSLEVSSPGLDEPLRLHRQYTKNIGRLIEVVLTDGTRKEGKLLEADEKSIVMEEKIGKKKEVIKHTFLFENIKTTKIQVVF